MLVQKICHKGPLQKIVSQPFSVNHEPHTVIAKLTTRNIMDVREGNLNEKLYFHKEKDCSSCQKLNLPVTYVGASNKLIFDGKLREAISERETGLSITTRIQQFEKK